MPRQDEEKYVIVIDKYSVKRGEHYSISLSVSLAQSLLI